MKKTTVLLLSFCLYSLTSLIGQIKQERKVESFNRIEVNNAIRVIVTIGEQESVVYESTEELLSQLKAEVKNGVLKLFLSGNTNTNNNTVAYVTVKNLKGLNASGASYVEVKNPVSTEKIDLEASGASCINLEIKSSETHVNVHGAANVKIIGQSNSLKANLSGAGSLKAGDLVTENTEVNVTGASMAHVNASQNLTGSASGAGCVKYNGEPKNKTVKVSSGGSIKKS